MKNVKSWPINFSPLLSAIVLAMVFAPTVAFSFSSYWDEIPAPVDVAYVVDASEDFVDSGKLENALMAFSVDTGVGLAIKHQGMGTSVDTASYYVVPGSELYERWLQKSPENFNPSSSVEVHPYNQYSSDKGGRGLYLLDAGSNTDAIAVQKFEELLGSYGLSGHKLSFNHLGVLQEPGVEILLGGLLLAFVLGFVHSHLNRRKIAIDRLHGNSIHRIVSDDLDISLSRLVGALIVWVLIQVIGLYVYNHFSAVKTYAAILTASLCVQFAVTFIGYFLSLAVALKVDLIRAIKGSVPAAKMAAIVYFARSIALLLALSSALSFVNNSSVLSRLEEEGKIWSSHKDKVIVYVGGHAGDNVTLLGASLRVSDKQNQLVLADSQWAMPLRNYHTDQSVVLLNRNAMRANNLDWVIDGQASDDIIVAFSRESQEKALDRAYGGISSEWEIFQSLQPEDARGKFPRVRSVSIPSSTRVFTFTTSVQGYSTPAILENPVLVILPEGLFPLSDMNLAAALSNGTALFESSSDAEGFSWRSQHKELLAGWEPASDRWLATTSRVRRSVGSSLAGLVLGIGLTTASLVLSLNIFHAAHRRKLRVLAVHGQHPFRGRGLLLATELAMCLGSFVWIVYHYWSVRNQLRIGSARSTELSEISAPTLSFVLGITIVTFTWLLLAGYLIKQDAEAVLRGEVQ